MKSEIAAIIKQITASCTFLPVIDANSCESSRCFLSSFLLFFSSLSTSVAVESVLPLNGSMYAQRGRVTDRRKHCDERLIQRVLERVRLFSLAVKA